jgi:hypothetical protein
MTAFNVVRFRIKPGREQEFIEAHRRAKARFKGFLGGWLVKTGENAFCVIGQWRNFKSLAAARPDMIGILDSFRDTLEDLGGDLGVTDPVSGEAVVKLAAERRPAKRAAPARAKKKRPAAKRARR